MLKDTFHGYMLGIGLIVITLCVQALLAKLLSELRAIMYRQPISWVHWRFRVPHVPECRGALGYTTVATTLALCGAGTGRGVWPAPLPGRNSGHIGQADLCVLFRLATDRRSLHQAGL